MAAADGNLPPLGLAARVERELAETSHRVAALSGPALRALAPVLAQAQRETAQALRDWLSRTNGEERYTPQMHRAVLAHLEQALHTVATLDPTLRDALTKSGVDAGRLAAGDAAREFDRLSHLFDREPTRLPVDVIRIVATGQRELIPRFRTSAARYAGDVGADIRRELAVGLARRESVSAMVDRLVRVGGPKGLVALRGVVGEPGAVTEHIAEGLFARYRYWGERVARTETQRAYNVQIDETLREAREHIPDLMRRWDASADLRICEVCAALHGAVTTIDGVFPGGYTEAPAHPNCLPAGEPITTPSGPAPIESLRIGDIVVGGLSGAPRRVTDVHRNPFVGELVVVRVGEVTLRLTPNHPVLTSRGWVDAGDLQLTDKLYRHVAQPRVVAVDGPASDAHDAPALGGERGLLHGILRALAARRVPVAGVDLDGHLLVDQGEVDVEAPHRELRHGRQTGLAHHVEEHRLDLGGCLRGDGASVQHQGADELLLAPHGGVRREGQTLPACLALAGHADLVGFGAVARGDAFAGHGGVERGAAASELARDDQHRELLVEVHPAHGVHVDLQPLHLHTVVPVSHRATSITSISREPFAGDVFNISVDVDESYLSRGVVVHNCRCRVGAWRRAWSNVIAGRVAVDEGSAAASAGQEPARMTAPAEESGGRLTIDEAEHAAQDFVDQRGLQQWLTSNGVTVVPVEHIGPRPGESLPPGEIITGDYAPDTKTIRVSTAHRPAVGLFERGERNVALGASDQREAVQRDVAHEVGESIFERLREQRSAVVQTVERIRRAANHAHDPLSRYGGKLANDYFSECVTAYYFERGTLTLEEVQMVEAAFHEVGIEYR